MSSTVIVPFATVVVLFTLCKYIERRARREQWTNLRTTIVMIPMYIALLVLGAYAAWLLWEMIQ